MKKSEVIVVGAGIAGLTSAAILSKQGLSVTLVESHTQAGGCAGTFKRKNYIFDVGATQVAGLEKGGIHSRIFDFLDIPSPEATILDPACIVDLNDGSNFKIESGDIEENLRADIFDVVEQYVEQHIDHLRGKYGH